MENIQEFVALGMDRYLAALQPTPGDNYHLNLGAGNKHIAGYVSLNEPEWMGGTEIPYGDSTVSEIISFHFFEHLTKDEFLDTLLECQRVLRRGGILNVVVPYYSAAIAHQDIDHKLFFTEETWKNIFDNPYYSKRAGVEWHFEVGFNLIAGIVERNLALFTQLVRT